MGCKATLGELCTFHRGASVPRARMFNSGNYLYIHYGDLYRGFEQRIDVEDPAKPLPFILDSEKIKETQFLHDQDIVYVLTSETVDDLGHAFLFNNPRNRIAVSGTETTIVRIQRKDMVLPAYLNYVMQSPRFIAELRQYVRGMKVFRVHPNDVARISVDLPSLDKQAKVVAILDAIFEKRLINNQINGYLAALGETMANRCSNETDETLDDICSQSKETVSLEAAQLETYVSTENLLPNKAGLQLSAGLPTSGKVTRYRKGDTLVANIRPYFKKIWYATDEGTCSGDVIVFRANDARYAPYVFFSLCRDEFFEYVMLGAKGTKMPRGDKKQMMTFPICTNCNSTDLQLLQELASTIGTNHAENRQLARLRDTLLPKLMSGEIDVSKVDLTQLNSHLTDC